MTEPENGIQRVDVDLKWPHEAHDFTPWMATHLDLLGNELGLSLAFVGREVQVGPFRLDILAETRGREGGDVLVAIENQFGVSDLQHLGQLLTYATGMDARIAVWVAPEFGHQLAEAVHRLNDWTRPEFGFYAVRVELVKRPDSTELEPRFRKAVWPGGWDEEATIRDGDQPEHVQLYGDFFGPLIAELVQSGFATGARQHFDHTGRFFTPGVDGRIGYAASMGQDGAAWVTFHVRTGDVEEANGIFDALHEAREAIESEFTRQLRDHDAADPNAPPSEWHWGRYDPFAFASISIRHDGSIHDPPEELDQIRRWMLTRLALLKKVFDPRIEAILDRLPADHRQ